MRHAILACAPPSIARGRPGQRRIGAGDAPPARPAPAAPFLPGRTPLSLRRRVRHSPSVLTPRARRGGSGTLTSADAEDALARYGRFFDLSLDLLCIAGFDGAFKRINRAFARATGYAQAELLAAPFLSFIHPADLDATVAEAGRLARGLAMLSLENRFRCKDGTYRWLAWNATSVREERLIYASARDVTERVRDREASRLLVEAGAVLADSLDLHPTLENLTRLAVPRMADWCVVDLVEPDGTMSRIASAGADPARDALARELARSYPLDPRRPNFIVELLRTRRAHFLPQLPADFIATHGRDERHRELLRGLGLAGHIIVPLIARDRAIGALTFAAADPARRYDERDLVLAEDLARRAAMAVDNARLYQESQVAIRTREHFLAIATHELRTPLTTIRGAAELLLRQLRRGDQPLDRAALTRRAELLLDGTGRMADLAARLLDVTRMQSGAFDITRRPGDLAALVAAVIERTRQALPQQPPTTIDYTAPDGPITGRFDPLRLEQVAVNLLDNAVKYQPRGGVVRVTLAERGRAALLTVRDEGIGIGPEDLPRLFAPFARGENAVADRFGGTGVGLYISDQIVRQHGGTIAVRSRVGRGTTFEVRLPLD